MTKASSSLIILRGNSGCGKTSTAKLLLQKLDCDTMLVSQDVVRREMLRVRDKPGNPAIDLIYDLCMYGNKIGHTVILEGILNSERYGAMLRKLIADFRGNTYVYYFDISFEETIRRHASKPNAHEFGKAKMRDWWKGEDFLMVDGEQIIDEATTQSLIVEMIMRSLLES